MDQQALMQMLLASQSSGGGLDSASIIQQFASSSDDPTARMLATMMAQRQPVSQDDDDDESSEENEAREARLAEARDRLEHAQTTLGRVYDELEAVRGRNQLLAEALGACPRCWGGDARCEVCLGAGRAGSVDPNPALFARFVVPALRRMGEIRRSQGAVFPARATPVSPLRGASSAPRDFRNYQDKKET